MLRTTLALLAGVSTSTAGDWPAWRGPEGTGLSTETQWNLRWKPGEAQLAWKTSVGTGLASVVTSGPRVFTLGNRTNLDSVVALEPRTGAALWTFSYPCPSVNYTNNISPHGPASTPVVSQGKLFALSREGHLHCLEAQTGRLLWNRHLIGDLGGRRPKYGYSGSPLVRGDLVYLDVGGTNASTVALEANTGAIRWQAEGGQAGYGTPAWIDDPKSPGVVLFKGEWVIAHEAATGKERWRVAWRGSEFCNTATPAVLEQGVVISGVKRQQSEDGDGTSFFAFEGEGVARRWHSKDLAAMFASPVAVGGRILGFHDARRPLKTLVALDAATGGTAWTSDLIENGGFLVAGDRLIVLTQTGQLVVARLTPEGPAVEAQAQVLGGKCYAAPTLSHGRIYCRSNAGELVCLTL